MTASGERAIEAVRAAWGGLDAAVATAGISMSVTGDARVDRLAEVAGIIEWLTSDDASYATGGYFTIDGGQTCL